MKRLPLLLAVFALEACGGGMGDPTVETAPDAGREADAAPPVYQRDCDGTSLGYYCRSFGFISTYRYGMATSCTGTPFLDVNGQREYRTEGRNGCVEVGPPAALCCP